MRLTIHYQASSSRGTVEEEVDGSMEVRDMKALLSETTGIDVDEQRLLCRGRVLRDHETLGSAGVADGATLHVLYVALPPPPPSPAAAAAAAAAAA